ncbi:MAG: hypothetical protein M1820_007129 [Bogoriella megaspora]|nr:MAG: hypothetical protein M1820_007129 [Bogoriella megaspora]
MPTTSPLQLFPPPPREQPIRKLSLDIERALSTKRPRNVPQSATTPSSKSPNVQQVVIKVTAEGKSAAKPEEVETIEVTFPPRTSSLKNSAELIRQRISDEIARHEATTPRSATPPRSGSPPSTRSPPRTQKRSATPERSCITPPPKAYTLDRKTSLRRTGDSPTSSPQKKTVAFSPVVSDIESPYRERVDSATGESPLRRSPSSKGKGKMPIEDPHAITADTAISPYAPRRTASKRSKQSSPVSTRSRNVATSPAFSDIPSVRSMSPTLVRDNSAVNTPLSPEGIPMRSMFPTYDPSKPLAQQYYQPMHVPPPSVPREAVSKPPYSPEFSKTAQSSPNASSSTSLPLLWDAANGQDTKGSLRTFNLPLFRSTPSNKDPSAPTTLTFGPSPKQPFYSLTSATTTSTPPSSTTSLTLTRHDPRHQSSSIPVTNLNLSSTAPTFCPGAPHAQPLTAINPKLAALLALDLAAQTPEACALALVDPNAESAAAAAMAEDAVRGAWSREGCQLTYSPAAGSSGRYTLLHPRLGAFPIEVRGDVSGLFDSADERKIAESEAAAMPGAGQYPFPKATLGRGGSVSVLHPLSTGAVPTRLATLDLGGRYEGLMVDVAQCLQIDSAYIVDVVVSAIMGVAAAERRRREALTFAPPPVTPRVEGREEEGKRKWWGGKKEGKMEKKEKKRGKKKGKGRFGDLEDMGGDEELPTLTRGLLQTLFLGFGAVVWILGVGIKIAAGLVVAGSMMVKKM